MKKKHVDIQIEAMEALSSSITITDMLDSDRPLIFCNNAFTEITGYSKEEVLGRNCKFLQNNDSQPNELNIIRNSFEEKKSCEVILRNYKKDGTLFFNQLKLAPIFNKKGKLTHYVGVQNDITDQIKNQETQKKIERKVALQKEILLKRKIEKSTEELSETVKELKKSNSKLKYQISQTEIAEKEVNSHITLLNGIAKNYPNGTILVINQNFEIDYVGGKEIIKTLGDDFDYSRDIRLDQLKNFKKKQLEDLKSKLKQTLKGDRLQYEVYFKGNYFRVNTTPLPTTANDNIKRALFVYINITEQKKLSNEIQKSLEKEQELNELKSRFIAIASHEFRTPLSAINLSTTFLEKLNNSQFFEKRLNYLNRIKNNTNDMTSILDDFLSLSKIEEGKTKPSFETFNVASFFKMCVDELQDIKKEGQKIILLNPFKDEQIILDKKLLHHVVQNLLTNAIKFSSENTEITLNIFKKNNHLNITVQDQGIGIPQKEQQHLFNYFFRAKNATNIEGFGIGLNIVKQYVTLMNGIIAFESKLNVGTTFKIIFPNIFENTK